ncbi:DUF3426 domain-containing protein [Desertibaculum subflavum]|uniref:DUF3426 domain-containing protein n=1 Tax=Desertibaculum subflavum TaxID=2268458 RepID=UPI000E671FE0
MILSCSACSTRFLVPDQALRPSGRKVKCGKCGSTWFTPPPANAPSQAELESVPPPPAPPPPTVAAATESPRLEAPVGASVGQPVDPMKAARERVANLPTVKEQPARRSSDTIGWLALAASVMIVIAAAYLGRDRVVSLLPAAQPYYAKLGIPVSLPERLMVRDVTTKQIREGGDAVLEVTGLIANESRHARPMPRLRIALLNEKREQIFEYTFAPEGVEVPGRGEIAFATKLAKPPAEAKHLDVTLIPQGSESTTR